MNSKLPATHLLRQFLLFALTVVFLLTMIRAAYGLWQFSTLSQADSLVPWFVKGLRYDIALVGLICFIPVILGSLLSMLKGTRALAKVMISTFLLSGLLLILVLELITPWFVQTTGLRPDFQVLSKVEQPLTVFATIFAEQALPVSVAIFLCLLIMLSFWARMEIKRFLKYRLSVPGGLVLAFAGGVVCLIAIRSTADLSHPGLSPFESPVSEAAVIDDLAMNSAYKFLYSIVKPGPVAPE